MYTYKVNLILPGGKAVAAIIVAGTATTAEGFAKMNHPGSAVVNSYAMFKGSPGD